MPVIDPEELENRGSYHAPTPEKIELHQTVRDAYMGLALGLNEILPSSREAMLALEHLLDYSLMMANAAIARRPLP